MSRDTRTMLRERAAVNIGWYVAVRNGKRQGLLYGPFVAPFGEADAASWVDTVRKEAEQVDTWAWGYDFGVARVEVPTDRPLPSGRLNARVDRGRTP